MSNILVPVKAKKGKDRFEGNMNDVRYIKEKPRTYLGDFKEMDVKTTLDERFGEGMGDEKARAAFKELLVAMSNFFEEVRGIDGFFRLPKAQGQLHTWTFSSPKEHPGHATFTRENNFNDLCESIYENDKSPSLENLHDFYRNIESFKSEKGEPIGEDHPIRIAYKAADAAIRVFKGAAAGDAAAPAGDAAAPAGDTPAQGGRRSGKRRRRSSKRSGKRKRSRKGKSPNGKRSSPNGKRSSPNGKRKTKRRRRKTNKKRR